MAITITDAGGCVEVDNDGVVFSITKPFGVTSTPGVESTEAMQMPDIPERIYIKYEEGTERCGFDFSVDDWFEEATADEIKEFLIGLNA